MRKILSIFKRHPTTLIPFLLFTMAAFLLGMSVVRYPGLVLLISVVTISIVFFSDRPLLLFGIMIGYAAFNQASFRYQRIFMFRDMNIRIVDVSVLAVVSLILWGIVNHRSKAQWQNKLVALWFVFVLLGLIGIARGLPQVGSLALGEARYYLFSSLLIPFFLIYVKSERSIIYLLTAVAIGATIGVFTDFMSFITQFLSGQRGLGRFSPAYNILAGSMAFLILLSAASGKYSRGTFMYNVRRYRGTLFLILLILGLIILLATHRSVWLGVMAGVLTLALLSYRTRGRLVIVTLLILVLLIALSLGVINEVTGGELSSYLAEKITFLKGYSEDPTARWRVLMWRQELEAAFKTPIFGRGFGNFSWTFDPNRRKWSTLWVHSSYIMLFSKLGLLGILAYILFWAGVTKKSFDLYKSSTNPVTLMLVRTSLACLVANLVFMLFYQETIFVWFFGGTLLALLNMATTEHKLNPKKPL